MLLVIAFALALAAVTAPIRNWLAHNGIRKLGGSVEVFVGPERNMKEAAFESADSVVMINLTGSSVSDSDLHCLRAYTGLQKLWLNRTNITAAGVTHLRHLDSLRVLNLSHTRVGDSALSCLGEMQSLRRLSLDNTAITDEGMPAVGCLVSLEELGLSNTRVTDQGLASLGMLKGLRLLQIADTGVTARGVRNLKKALPELHVQGVPVREN